MRKIMLSNIQPLDNTLYRSGMGGFEYNMLSGQTTPCEVLSSEECPVCHYGIDLEKDTWRNYHDITSNDQKECNIFSVHICPHCHNGFVIRHHLRFKKNEWKEQSQSTFPMTAKEVNIDETIRMISPKFYEIYNQCLIAKNYGY